MENAAWLIEGFVLTASGVIRVSVNVVRWSFFSVFLSKKSTYTLSLVAASERVSS